MSHEFEYRPKFRDIRVRPPKEGEEEQARDVNALKPGERRCDHPDCAAIATARAPKSRKMLNEHYWFCQPHAAAYNKSWDFYSGMSEGEIRAAKETEAVTGGRPTWEFRASNASREAAASAGASNDPGAWKDPFGIASATRRRAQQASEGPSRNLGRIERAALADMGLDENADASAIRARYTDLIKRLHPDSNGGDRSMEDKLGKVIKAYKTLKKAKLA